MPTLAERIDYIPDISKFLLQTLKNTVKELPKFSEEAFNALKRHLWPGNIRELKNVLERACILFSGEIVNKSNVMENLLRLKVPTSEEEQKALWDATQGLSDFNEDKGICNKLKN